MKVLLVCAAYPPHGKGGGPAASRTIAHALAKYNDLTVITVSDCYDQWLDGNIKVRAIGSPNIYWNYWRPHSAAAKLLWHFLENFNPRAFLRISREIEREKPDIIATVSTENINVATWLAGRVRGIPTVHFIQSYFLLCWRGSMFKRNNNCQAQCLSCKLVTLGRKHLSSCVDLVFAEAESTLKIHFEHRYFQGAASFVAPGMLTDIPVVRPRAQQYSDGPLRIGYIGLLSYNKGVHLIAQAAKKLSNPSLVTVTIAGDGDTAYRDELIQQFNGLSASFAGWVIPSDFYDKIDVLIVPSIWREPFGRVCIEAFAAGTVVVAANIGGLATIVKDHRNGFLFEPGNADHLAAILDSILRNREQLRGLQTNCELDAQLYHVDRVGLTIQREFQALYAKKASVERA